MNSVEVSYYDFQLNSHVLKMPLLVLAVCSACFGFTVAWVGGLFGRLKLQSQIRKLGKSNEVLKEDLDQLKSASVGELSESAD